MQQSSLVNAVTQHSGRAVEFFGEKATFGQMQFRLKFLRELRLRCILDAKEMLSTPDDALLEKLNRSRLARISELGEISSSDLELMKNKWLYNKEKINLLKQKLWRYVESRTGRPYRLED